MIGRGASGGCRIEELGPAAIVVGDVGDPRIGQEYGSAVVVGDGRIPSRAHICATQCAENRAAEPVCDVRAAGAAGVEECGVAAKPVDDRGGARGIGTKKEGCRRRTKGSVVGDRGDAGSVGIDDVEEAFIGDGADHASRGSERSQSQRPTIADRGAASRCW